MAHKRPKGITFLSIILILVGSISIVSLPAAGLLKKGISSLPAEEKLKLLELDEYKKLNISTIEELDTYTQNQLKKGKITPIRVFLNFFILIAGIGLWSLKEWARIGLISYLGLGIINTLFSTFTGNFNSVILIKTLLIIGILWYLFKPDVRQLFKSTEKQHSVSNN